MLFFTFISFQWLNSPYMSFSKNKFYQIMYSILTTHFVHPNDKFKLTSLVSSPPSIVSPIFRPNKKGLYLRWRISEIELHFFLRKKYFVNVLEMVENRSHPTRIRENRYQVFRSKFTLKMLINIVHFKLTVMSPPRQWEAVITQFSFRMVPPQKWP